MARDEHPPAPEIVFSHERERHRFVALRGDDVVGEAHYRLLGDTGIDFDHTVVDPSLRGSGVAARLVRHALADDLAHGRHIEASCSYVAALLDRHPELRDV